MKKLPIILALAGAALLGVSMLLAELFHRKEISRVNDSAARAREGKAAKAKEENLISQSNEQNQTQHTPPA